VGSVAEGTVAAVLATAEKDRPVLFRCVGSWGKIATLVGPIAERLSGTFATRTPVIGLASFDFDGNGRFLGDDGFGHKKSVGWI